MKCDVAIIGAGIVGLSTAYNLIKKSPGLKVVVLDKEPEIAAHQTGHNSGVIHSGIYYKPGSLKAVNCIKGYNLLIDFCQENNIPFDLCGKLIVATRKEELPFLDKIMESGKANGLTNLELLDRESALEIEPHINCVKAIKVPQTGIISFRAVALKYSELLKEMGGQICCNHKVLGIRKADGLLHVETNQNPVAAKCVVNCAGLYADKIANMTMPDVKIQIIPFRGEYYNLKPAYQYLVNHLIYPVPDPDFPFLGVHFTRMIAGGIEAGPNAVLAFKKEGYSRWDFDRKEFAEIVRFAGFQLLAAKFWRKGLGELHRSFSKNAFVRALQHLIPEIQESFLERGNAGVRAMACSPDGSLVKDYLVLEDERVLNVLNAPSPAATSSLAIGDMLSDMVLKRDFINFPA